MTKGACRGGTPFPPALKGLYRSVVTISVDCDSIRHYRNFAPLGTEIAADDLMYTRCVEPIRALFRAMRIRATFFVVGEDLDVPGNLEIAEKLVRDGHEIANHTYSHPDCQLLSPTEVRQEIRRGHDALQRILGVSPVGYRAPAYYLTDDSVDEIAALDYMYDSSILNTTIGRVLPKVFRLLHRDFRPREQRSSVNARFPRRHSALRINCRDGKRLCEWAIPTTPPWGLPFYGTLHCAAPGFVFKRQLAWLKGRGAHLHYEIHPIEVMDEEMLNAHPWLRSAPAAWRKDRLSFLQHRLRALLAGRRAMTLKDFTNENLRLLDA